MNYRAHRIKFQHLAAFLIALAAGNPASAQTEAGVTQVVPSDLPQGNGLAAAIDADRQPARHPSIRFADNFEVGELGKSWDEIRNPGKAVLSLSPPDAPGLGTRLGKRALKVTAALGKNTGGGLTKWFPSSERVFIRFYTKFDADCDYVHHFCTLRANASLQGNERWSGFGGAGNAPDGALRFSTAIEPWGNWGKWPAPGRWNFYSYWHSMKPSPDGRFWGNGFRPEVQPDIQRNTWICVEMMLKHNTPGKNDGEQAYWIDGKLAGHWRGISWRTSPTLWANAFTLESYVTDRWTKHETNIVYFDNVIIAEEYIGPAQSN